MEKFEIAPGALRKLATRSRNNVALLALPELKAQKLTWSLTYTKAMQGK